MNDNSLMPFGRHKGEKLANVPAAYLLWLYDTGKLYGELKQYVIDNIPVLRFENQQTKKEHKQQ